MTIRRSAITALIPIKDGAIYIPRLRAQIEASLSDQDEIIIVNDFSSDGTLGLLEQWAREDSRLHLLNAKIPGIANALNLGLNNATNKWVARFDVDDQYSAERINAQLGRVEPSTVVVFSDYSFQDPELRFIGIMPSAVFPNATSVSLVSSQRTPHPVALLNRDAVLSIGGYRQEDFPAEDLSLWLRLSKIGQLVSSPQLLLKYTINPLGVSSTKRNSQLAKKHELLSGIGLNKSDFDFVIQNTDQIFNQYNSLKFGGLRKVLLMRELVQASEYLNIRLKYSKTSILRHIDLKDMPELINFGVNTFNRKRMRFLN